MQQDLEMLQLPPMQSGGVKVMRYKPAQAHLLPDEDKLFIAWDSFARNFMHVTVDGGFTVMDLINTTVVRVDWEEGGTCRAWLSARIPEKETWLKINTLMRDEGFKYTQELDTAKMDLLEKATAQGTQERAPGPGTC